MRPSSRVGIAGRIAEDAGTMSRPDILFPLFADLTSLDGVGPKTAKLLARMEIARPPTSS